MKRILVLICVLFTQIGYSQNFETGKTIFKENCSSCHKMDAKLLGPPLQNTVEDQGRDWTQKWIYNSQLLIQEGDTHANEIYNEYNQMAMPAYSWLEDEEMSALLDYLEGWKTNQPVDVVEAVSTIGGTVQIQRAEVPNYIWILVGITLFVLILAVGVIIGAIRALDKHFNKVSISNAHLTKKFNMSLEQVNMEADEVIDREVSKRVSEKVKSIKEEIDDSLKNFK